MKEYLIVSYAYLVKVGRYDLEPIDGSIKKVVPVDYRTIVAERLIGA